jgi:hypothetical protein
MPRKSRIDAPGALHHVIARGIKRENIFFDETDKNNFLNRLSALLKDSIIKCMLGQPSTIMYIFCSKLEPFRFPR